MDLRPTLPCPTPTHPPTLCAPPPRWPARGPSLPSLRSLWTVKPTHPPTHPPAHPPPGGADGRVRRHGADRAHPGGPAAAGAVRRGQPVGVLRISTHSVFGYHFLNSWPHQIHGHHGPPQNYVVVNRFPQPTGGRAVGLGPVRACAYGRPPVRALILGAPGGVMQSVLGFRAQGSGFRARQHGHGGAPYGLMLVNQAEPSFDIVELHNPLSNPILPGRRRAAAWPWWSSCSCRPTPMRTRPRRRTRVGGLWPGFGTCA